MDPFTILDPFLFELVLQHFNGKESLNVVSLVSPGWNEVVGNSKSCMSKVKFSYQVWRHQLFSSTEVFTLAANSCRRYQNVIIDLEMNDDLQQFWKFIEACCDSIVTLKVENVRTTENLRSDLEFPLMETFRAFGIDGSSLEVFLTKTHKLKDLFIFISDLTAANKEVIDVLVSCLKRNDRLEELYFKNAHLLDVFSEDLPFTFKLKSLKLMSTVARHSITEQIEENLIKFLQKQSSSLETFLFDFSSLKIVEHAFNELPMLKSIGILDFPIISLKQNKKLTSLEIPCTEDLGTIKRFVTATPNLESLLVGLATKELIEHLAWNCMTLRSLNFNMIDVDGEEFYEKLMSDHPEVNQNIDIWDSVSGDWD